MIIYNYDKMDFEKISKNGTRVRCQEKTMVNEDHIHQVEIVSSFAIDNYTIGHIKDLDGFRMSHLKLELEKIRDDIDEMLEGLKNGS